jgi:hypothetical protein
LYLLAYIKRRENHNETCSEIKNTHPLSDTTKPRPTNKFVMSTRSNEDNRIQTHTLQSNRARDSRWRSPAHTHLKLSGSLDRTAPFRWVPRELFYYKKYLESGARSMHRTRANKKPHGRCLFRFRSARWFAEKNQHGFVELMTETESV